MQRAIQPHSQEEKDSAYMDEYNTVVASIHIDQLVNVPWELCIHPGGCQVSYPAQVYIDSLPQVFHTSLHVEVVHVHLGVRTYSAEVVENNRRPDVQTTARSCR